MEDKIFWIIAFITGICLVLLGFMFAIIFMSLYTKETVAPFDRINEKDIIVYPDKVIINISNVRLIDYADTNSMIPTLDKGHNGLRIDVTNESDIHIGDIITYEIRECKKPEDVGLNVELQNNSNITKVEICSHDLIVHRVIKIENDENGTYYILKGDANAMDEVINGFGKVRFNQVKGVLIGLIY